MRVAPLRPAMGTPSEPAVTTSSCCGCPSTAARFVYWNTTLGLFQMLVQKFARKHCMALTSAVTEETTHVVMKTGECNPQVIPGLLWRPKLYLWPQL